MSTFLNAYSTVTSYIEGAPQAPRSTRTVVESTAGIPFLSASADSQAEQSHLKEFDQFIWHRGTQDISDPNQVGSHILALSNHVLSTRWHYVFEVADNFGPQHLAAFAQWADQTNSIFVMADLSIRDAAGRNLLEEQKPPRPASAIRRMARIRGGLWNQGIQIPENLPAAQSEEELLLRRPEEVQQRAQALLAISSIAHSAQSGMPLAEIPRAHYSPSEQRFVDGARSQQSVSAGAPFALGATQVLAWALSLSERVDPGQLPALDSLERDLSTPATSFRPLPDIADELELCTCLRWWDIEHPQHPEFTNALLGRIYALLWLSTPQVPWDDTAVNI